MTQWTCVAKSFLFCHRNENIEKGSEKKNRRWEWQEEKSMPRKRTKKERKLRNRQLTVARVCLFCLWSRKPTVRRARNISQGGRREEEKKTHSGRLKLHMWALPGGFFFRITHNLSVRHSKNSLLHHQHCHSTDINNSLNANNAEYTPHRTAHDRKSLRREFSADKNTHSHTELSFVISFSCTRIYINFFLSSFFPFLRSLYFSIFLTFFLPHAIVYCVLLKSPHYEAHLWKLYFHEIKILF